MKKLAFFFSLIILPLILTGCNPLDKSADYSNFVRRDSGQPVNESQKEGNNSLQIYNVYPPEITTEGKQQITIDGAGFSRGASVFLQNPKMKIEAFVFNPGYLQAWMPPFPAGYYILGVINPDGSEARWSGVFTYVEKN